MYLYSYLYLMMMKYTQHIIIILLWKCAAHWLPPAYYVFMPNQPRPGRAPTIIPPV